MQFHLERDQMTRAVLSPVPPHTHTQQYVLDIPHVSSCGPTSQTSCLRCMPGSPGPCVCSTTFPLVPKSPVDGDRSIFNCFAYTNAYSERLQAYLCIFHLYRRCRISKIHILAQYRELEIQCTGLGQSLLLRSLRCCGETGQGVH